MLELVLIQSSELVLITDAQQNNVTDEGDET